ncbi:MAG: MarR family winged helix-turn-helix transcriptional regulator [Rhizobiaceae bacterium]
MSLIAQEEIDQILNIRILGLASKMSLIFQRETLRPAGIKVQQWRILVSLAQYGELHLRALARHSSQDPAHTSRVVRSMISDGLITSRPDEDDMRRIKYELTAAGTKIIKKHWPDAKRFAADIAELFDSSEFNQMKDMLDRANELCDARLQESGNQ